MERDGEVIDWAAEAERLAAEFFDALQRLYIRAGEPPLRTVAARSDRLSASNLSALLSGRRTALPNYEVMTAAVTALLHEAPAAERQRELQRWRDRWTEAKYARKQAQKASAQKADQLAQAAARGVEQAQLEAEAIVAAAHATAEDLVKHARMDADTATMMRAEADRTIRDARNGAELILGDAHDEASRLKAAAESMAESIIAAAQAEVERIRRTADRVLEVADHKALEKREQAKSEAEAIVAAAREQAADLVAEARKQSELLVSKAKEEAKQARQQLILDELERTHRSVQALSASSRPASPSPAPSTLTTADEIAELDRQDTRYDPEARITPETFSFGDLFSNPEEHSRLL